MQYYRYHVTWLDDGDNEIAKFETEASAKTWRDFLEICARDNGAIRGIELIVFD
jgi:predicted TPR repeat methyltransferase